LTKARDNANGGLGLILIKPSSVVNGTDNGKGTVSFSSSASTSLNNVFNSTFENYKIIFNWTQNNTNQLYMRLRASSSDNSGANYGYSGFTSVANSATLTTSVNSDGNTVWRIGYATGSDVIGGACEVTVFAPQNASRRTSYQSNYTWYDNTRFNNGWTAGGHNQLVSYDGITFFCDGASPLITGTVSVYGIVK